mmetsp:Transcript_11550/g.41179  ORF Transcript_11550/g.41179 Transcript_11550/m.41179 type:complete len:210 (-) Transcript_11550:2042-2671(-)
MCASKALAYTCISEVLKLAKPPRCMTSSRGCHGTPRLRRQPRAPSAAGPPRGVVGSGFGHVRVLEVRSTLDAVLVANAVPVAVGVVAPSIEAGIEAVVPGIRVCNPRGLSSRVLLQIRRREPDAQTGTWAEIADVHLLLWHLHVGGSCPDKEYQPKAPLHARDRVDVLLAAAGRDAIALCLPVLLEGLLLAPLLVKLQVATSVLPRVRQ